MSLLNAALDLAVNMKWKVLPCRPFRKTPLTTHGYKDASENTKQIQQWWSQHPDANPAVSCALSGLFVIDVDPRHGGESTMLQLTRSHGRLPPTVTAATGGGGWHLLYKLPEGKFHRTLGPGVDLQVNAYIVVPPSVHPSGRRYRWLENRAPGDLEVAKMPPEWLSLVVKPTTRRQMDHRPRALQLGTDGTPYGIAALEAECRALTSTAQGYRNNRLNIAAVALARLTAGGEIHPDLARAKLEFAALASGLGLKEVQRTIASGWSYGMGQPPRRAPERLPRRWGPTPYSDHNAPPERRGAP